MKPRNARQREVVALSATLPAITDRQRRWAFAHCSLKEAYQSKGMVWCGECGGIFKARESDLSATVLGLKTVCPHCGARVTVKSSRRQKYDNRFYFTIVTTCGGYQVCRNFSVRKYVRKGEAPYCEIDEAVQNWIAPDGTEEVIARPVAALSGYYDCWQFHKPMELRDGRRHAYMPDKYRISGTWVYPCRRLLPIVRRNGYTGRNNCGIPESEHIRMLLTDNEAEWLEKTGQYALFGFKYSRGTLPYRHSIKVANRAGYKVKDASMWIDYIEFLEYFRLDTHNAHYVCPRNLKAAHDRLHKRWSAAEARLEKERQEREALENEARYKAAKSAYFGICFGNDDIVVTVIQSVADMIEEGKVMHHCVGGYHGKKDSLILSARDKDGKRLETVEVSLKTFQVVQSRARCNGTSPLHDDIVRLVTANMGQIREIAQTASG